MNGEKLSTDKLESGENPGGADWSMLEGEKTVSWSDYEKQRDAIRDRIRDNFEALEQRKKERERGEKALRIVMSRGVDYVRQRERQRFEKQRIQELIERRINSRLTTIDNLEDEVLGENSEVGKRLVEYEDGEIAVYDLKGLPFAMIGHSIHYRKANKVAGGNSDFGVKVSERLADNPSIWTETREEAVAEAGSAWGLGPSGGGNGEERLDTISTSYFGSDFDGRVIPYYSDSGDHTYSTVYGFDHLEGGALLKVDKTDGRNFGLWEERSDWESGAGDRVKIAPGEYMDASYRGFDFDDRRIGLDKHSLDVIDDIENNKSAPYNELLLRRYYDDGRPRLPSYIIAENGHITENMLKHAKFFDIPIVNIETRFYTDKK